MFRLTREVRFAINAQADDQHSRPPSNSYAGFPSLTGVGHYFTLQVTLTGDLDPRSQYLRNIKEIDQEVRGSVVMMINTSIGMGTVGGGAEMASVLFMMLKNAWPGATLDSIRFNLSPFLSYTVLASEHPMVRLSQRFEFSASHRLHNPALSPEENRRTFGKCNNPQGHGHNYEVQVTLTGRPDQNGLLIDIPQFERIVAGTVIERFDHKNLNAEIAEFRDVIPTVENIARTIHQLLKPKLAEAGAMLAGVTVWETPKTWCEYSECA